VREGDMTDLIVCADDLIADFDLALLHLPNVQHVAVVHLHILNFELCLAVDSNHTRVVLLTTLFSVEVCSVKKDTERCATWELGCR
jgi:hypothetical protein